MAATLITISDAFRAALVAPGNTGTGAHKVTKIGLCNAAFDAFNPKLTALPNELKRIDTFGGQNIDADTIHVTLQDSTEEQYTFWGFGFYLEDGTLAAYYSQKAADGPIMEKAPAAQLLLSVDVQFASIDAATLSFPSASFLNPPASEDLQGVIELATQAETDAGTDDARAVTPKKAAMRYAPKNSPKFTGRVLIGTTLDDGTRLLQVAGDVKQVSSTIDGGAGFSTLYLSNNGKTRWTLGKRDSAETGNSAGGEFFLNAWKDDGSQASVLTVSRASQVASFVQRPVFNGATPWDSANFNPANYATTADRDATNSQVNAKVNKGGDTISGRIFMGNGTNGNLPELAFRRVTGDAQMFMRGWGSASNAGIEFVNSAYSAVVASIDNGGRAIFNNGMQAGSAQFNNDGNVYMPIRGGWLNNYLNDLYSWRDNLNANKADRNANCQWNSGAWESDAFSGANQRKDCPAPYVMVGQFLDGGGYWHMRGIVLRNN